MFLRCHRRVKDGKTHHYWSVVEDRRLSDHRVVQRQVLYLGEINDSQRAAWRKTIEVFDAGSKRQVALFPEGRVATGVADVVRIRLSELQLKRPRQWGACWLSDRLWHQLKLNDFWGERLPPSREGTPWLQVLHTLVAYRLIDPGSEWRLHRHWFDASAMADVLNADFALAQKNTLYRCLDKLVEHKDALFKFLCGRWGELFGARFDVLLYDLTKYLLRDGHAACGGRQAAIRLQPRQALGLPAGGDRIDRHAGGLSVELRSARWQHCGLHDAE